MQSSDKIKVLLSMVLVVLGIVGFYLVDPKMGVLRVAAVVAGLLLGSAVMYTSQQGKDFLAYARDSIQEAKKVVWPTRKETIQLTGVVFVFVVVLAVFLWLVDSGLQWLFNVVILGRGK